MPDARGAMTRVATRVRPLLLGGLALLAGCSLHLREIQEPARAAAVPASFPWSSMIYAARTESGVVVVDLGWFGAERSLRGVLGRLGAQPEDVTDVFLTHSHRDHVAAWRLVRGARFHVARSEAPLFAGDSAHTDLPSRLGERVFGHESPAPGEVEVHPFRADTIFVLGGDTLRAFVVPGHTPGSAAYLLRGVLFAGDAISHDPLRGFGGAKRIFTRDPAAARASVASLWTRALPHGVEWVCNAHAKCARPTPRFLEKTTR